MLDPIKIKIYDQIDKIKIIIQDFPLFINEGMNFGSISIKLKSLGILYLKVYKTIIPKISIKSKMKDGFIKIIEKASFSIKNSITLSSKTKEKSFASFNIKNTINIYSIPNKVKTLQKATGTIKIPDTKAYLDPNGYIIGVPATLGYWDDHYLKEMDDMTISDISVIENIE